MLQHPIPQNIATYQFRLIGNMTLKQFIELIIGIVIAIFIFKTNLFFLFKWTLILLSCVIGMAAAFLPYDDRPLDQWFVNFIKAIYAPTQYFWQKQGLLPSFFNYVPLKRSLTSEENQALFNAAINKKRAGLTSYLQSLSPGHLTSNLEENISHQADYYLSLFGAPKTSLNLVSPVFTTPPATLPLTPSPAPPPTPNTPTTISAPAMKTVVIKPAPHPRPSPTPAHNQPIKSSAFTQPAPSQTLYPAQKPPTPRSLVQVSNKLPFPTKPTTPNTIVGMVFGPQGNIIENAIIEIRDSAGNPVRATKTNKLGQFFSSTSLKSGTYEIEIDAPPYQFAILKLELNNKIVDPLSLRALS